MSQAEHPLVVVGDSLSQGFRSGAVSDTEHTWGAMVAKALGIEAAFKAPTFHGAGGLPVNIERLLRRMSEHFGTSVAWYEFIPMLTATRGLMAETEHFWERGPGSQPTEPERFHNLSVWGFEVRDAYSVNGRVCRSRMEEVRNHFVKQIPEDAMYRTAARVLNPSADPAREGLSALDQARELGRKGGIERLVVALGANNALGTVLSLDVRWSEDGDLHRLPFERTANLYRPEHFALLYAQLEQRVQQVEAEQVFVATVPHVTVAPVTRGVSLSTSSPLVEGGAVGRRYFEYYTRPWIWDDHFDPGKHDHLTRAQAIEIDRTIDAYNEVIAETAARRGWHLVDLCGLLDRMAYRSSGGDPAWRAPQALVRAAEENPYSRYLVNDGRLMLDTRYLKATPYGDRRTGIQRLERGGYFSLDGVHPTVTGSGVMADLFLETMKSVGAAPEDAALDWEGILDTDRLVLHPPALLVDLEECLVGMQRHWGWAEVLSLF